MNPDMHLQGGVIKTVFFFVEVPLLDIYVFEVLFLAYCSGLHLDLSKTLGALLTGPRRGRQYSCDGAKILKKMLKIS